MFSLSKTYLPAFALRFDFARYARCLVASGIMRRIVKSYAKFYRVVVTFGLIFVLLGG